MRYADGTPWTERLSCLEYKSAHTYQYNLSVHEIKFIPNKVRFQIFEKKKSGP